MGEVISPQLLAIFAHLIEEACGVHYGPHDRAIFAAKLEAHAQELDHGSLLDFYYRLRYDDPGGVALQRLIEAILVHETYFFRELAPLQELVDSQLTDAIRARGHARVWSAACSTGEEPFTLAMLLAERGILDQVEIVASDISATAIARAQTGRHGARSLRGDPPSALRDRYLVVASNGVAVAPRIHDAVKFRIVNLLDDAAIDQLGSFDAILCRNVLIYFRDETSIRVVERLGRALEPRGVIAVGVAESLLRLGTALACEERDGSFFYRRAR
jgi:chemotaxis protein methyltransferase CheR